MSSCIPCGKLTPALSHLNECYPPSKQLVAAGPDYKPLSQDLSKLVYFAVNKPSQLAKIGEELEKRVAKEARGSTGGYAKSRASLLISLAILKSLISECKRDLNLFSRSALRVIVLSLDVKVYQKGGPDLEVLGRAASCFTSFATYTDGGPIGVDDTLTADYITALRKFGQMAVEVSQGSVSGGEKPDTEYQSRTRLIGLASLSGASGSDALFLSDTDFARQIGIILPALLANLFEATMDEIKLETAKIQMDASPSPYFSEFSARRPVNDRRAPSLHAHIPGEKGPSGSDVLSAALRSLKALVAQCQVNQLTMVLDAVFTFLDRQRWMDVERSCWLTEELARSTSLQYRFVIPSRLVELLADLPDTAPTPKQSTVLAMITTILNSSVSLVGLGISDILGNLLSIIIRRVHVDQRDALLPPLVQCIASLGTHMYYADQINDIIEEISQRIAEIPPTDKDRPETLRVLIYCILGVLRVVHAADDREAQMTSPISPSVDKGKGPQLDTPLDLPTRRQATARRNPVLPQVWQETLPLLCEATYPVRAVYARALLLFLEREIPREIGAEGARPGGDMACARFSNALHAALYTLAMSACLGTGAAVPEVNEDSPGVSAAASPVQKADTRLPAVNGEKEDQAKDGKAEKGVSFNIVEPTPSATPSTGTPRANGHSIGNGTPAPAPPASGKSSPPHKARRFSRRVSLPLNRLNSSLSASLSSFDNVATPLDFAYIVKVLQVVHTVMPSVALLTGGPMLLALDAAAGTELVRRPGDGRQGAWVLERKRGVRETVGFVWRFIGERWSVTQVEGLADKALSALPGPYVIPALPTMEESEILPGPDEPLSFMQHMIEGESSSASQPILNGEVLVSALASSSEVQRTTKRDAQGLVRRLGAGWSVETALRDSVERFSSAKIDLPNDTHFDIANVLMTIDNSSYHSFARPSQAVHTKTVDVSDLREALGQGQGSTATANGGTGMGSRVDTMSNSGAASVVSTTGTGGYAGDGLHGSPQKSRTGAGQAKREDVKEVLKDIFKDKRKNAAKRAVVA